MCVSVCVLSHVELFATPTLANRAPLSMGSSRQDYWSGMPFPSPGDLPDPGVEPCLLQWQADSLPLVPPGKPYIHKHSYVFTNFWLLFTNGLYNFNNSTSH